MAAKKKTGKKRGPVPQVLKIEGDWVEAVGRALKAGKPKAKKARRKNLSHVES